MLEATAVNTATKLEAAFPSAPTIWGTALLAMLYTSRIRASESSRRFTKLCTGR